jgi:N-acetylglucosamine malate deacetylase 1
MSGQPFYPPRVFRYMAVHQRVFVEPDFVVECATELAVKIESLRAYESQFGAQTANAGITEMIERMALMWGGVAGVPAGEPFFALEPIALSSPDLVL